MSPHTPHPNRSQREPNRPTSERNELSGHNNLSIAQVAALKHRKERDASGLILVEGRHPIEEALRAGLTLKTAFIDSTAPEASLPQTPWPKMPQPVNARTMARLSDTHSPPPCVAVFSRPAEAKNAPASSNPFVLVLIEVQDPGNLGTLNSIGGGLWRGFLLLLGNGVDAYNPKVIRASAGLIFRLPVATRPLADADGAGWTDFFPLFPTLPHAKSWRMMGATSHDAPNVQSWRKMDYTGPFALLLGNEGRGIPTDLHTPVPIEWVTIPMASGVESLNVAVSGSILLAEAAARREGLS